MVVVMTGSPGGSIGGFSGPSFGSGLTSLHPTTNPMGVPNIDTWSRRSDEDRLMISERRAEYDELRNARLAMVSAQKKGEADRKAVANKAFTERQQKRLEAEAKEKKALRVQRREWLAKPTLGDPELGTANNRKHLEAQSVLDEDAVAQWLWPTVKKYPDLVISATLSAEHEDAMTSLPPNVDADTLQKYVDNITHNSHELSRQAAAVRKAVDDEQALVEEQEKKEDEAAVNAMRAEQRRVWAEQEKAKLARSKQIKKEMAAATAKQKKMEEEKARLFAEKAKIERERLVKLLKADNKLRDEDEIANERREGSAMNKGAKGDFVKSAKEGADMAGF